VRLRISQRHAALDRQERIQRNDSDVNRTSGLPKFSTPNVPTRVNSPSDVAFDERDNVAGNLTFSATDLGSFNVLNTVQPAGIHPLPNVFTGGDGPFNGEEMQFDVSFTQPFLLPADHYFFVPQVGLTNGGTLDSFLWLSAPKPIVAPCTPFMGDLQSWTRDDNKSDSISPD